MARHHNPNITVSGLGIYIDVNNPRSYNFSLDNPVPQDIKKGGSSTVTLYNSPTTNEDHIDFNGTNYKRIVKDGWKGGSFQPDYVTASMWIYPKSNASTSDNNIITVEGSFEVRFRRYGTSGCILAYAGNPWAWRGPAGVVMPLEKWSLVTYVHGATTDKLYVNDNKVHDQAHSGLLGSGSASYPYITLMARYSGNGSRARAKFGALYLYDRALSDDEIAQLFYARRGKYNV